METGQAQGERKVGEEKNLAMPTPQRGEKVTALLMKKSSPQYSVLGATCNRPLRYFSGKGEKTYKKVNSIFYHEKNSKEEITGFLLKQYCSPGTNKERNDEKIKIE